MSSETSGRAFHRADAAMDRASASAIYHRPVPVKLTANRPSGQSTNGDPVDARVTACLRVSRLRAAYEARQPAHYCADDRTGDHSIMLGFFQSNFPHLRARKNQPPVHFPDFPIASQLRVRNFQ